MQKIRSHEWDVGIQGCRINGGRINEGRLYCKIYFLQHTNLLSNSFNYFFESNGKMLHLKQILIHLEPLSVNIVMEWHWERYKVSAMHK